MEIQHSSIFVSLSDGMISQTTFASGGESGVSAIKLELETAAGKVNGKTGPSLEIVSNSAIGGSCQFGTSLFVVAGS